MEDVTRRAEVLDMAKELITGDRNQDYGDPMSNFYDIARLWSQYLGTVLSVADVAAMMVLLKVARLKRDQTKLDSWVDIAGYAACGAEVIKAD